MPGIDGKFVVEQLHIHTSTEHSLDGNLSDFELHGVHRLEEGTGEQEETGLANANAVFGIRITAEAGAEDNEAFQPLLDGWQVYFDDVLATGICQNVVTRQGGTRRKLQVGVFNIYDLVPDNLEYFFHYDGSLTTPPCSEAVWWNVANEPVIISEAQKEQLNTLILEHRNADTCELATVADPATGSTSRAAQDLNGRSVSTYCLDAGTISLNTGVTSSSMTKSLLGPVAIVSAALALF
jgi:carbonic anhydrase